MPLKPKQEINQLEISSEKPHKIESLLLVFEEIMLQEGLTLDIVLLMISL